ncbi:hypothetical protein DXT99_20250 [Pontibacter diazotrophicus]|uniref:DUF3857 domain-containing protein n=1 Tax=Pontibacter diazotrophicus TaxID=1400979 RepID=A0A3D8L8N7_9BACT|nr:hypothetical protein [Pontibacter diazotrophicus]RDV13352.1 hypothetical protein DXT99_20250 [Pontibacter diazotrophicus]
MKKAYLSVLLLVVFHSLCFSQTVGEKEYRITIKEWAMGADNHFIITADSVKIRKSAYPEDIYYTSALTKEESQKIFAPIEAVDLRKLEEPVYVFTAPLPEGELSDHGYQYDIMVQKGSVTKGFHIERVKVDFLYAFISRLNHYLPDKFKVGYNDTYLKK